MFRGYFYIGPFNRIIFNWKRCAARRHIVCCDLCCERTDGSPFCEKKLCFLMQQYYVCNNLSSCNNSMILSHQHDLSPPTWFFPTNMIVPLQHDPLSPTQHNYCYVLLNSFPQQYCCYYYCYYYLYWILMDFTRFLLEFEWISNGSLML